MTTYFISDLHLHAGATQQQQLLLNFLRNQGKQADALYILGDLFAIWFGDDLIEEYTRELFAALRDLKIPVYFMRGNRDFLIGEQFCATAGCTLLADPCVIELYGKTVLLTHGDLLCTADRTYQRMRKFIQNSLIKAIFLSLPKTLRRKIALWVQRKAKRAAKDSAVYDVAPSTVNAWFTKFNAPVMIHGHTHLPALHQHGNNTRIVLGDWNDHSALILAYSEAGFALQNLVI